MITLGQPGDPTNDATLAWPENRERVDVGMLTIEQIASEEDGPCRDINFDPLVLPSSIFPSDDPLLSARSAAYSQSFTRRAGETKEPSAVTSGRWSILILIFVVVRYVNRRLNPPPPFLSTISSRERRVASASELFLYALMLALPLIGWSMLSTARYPIMRNNPSHLPFILRHSAALYAVMRKAHTILAFLLFATFIAHFGLFCFTR